jgi:hypothetical protein
LNQDKLLASTLATTLNVESTIAGFVGAPPPGRWNVKNWDPTPITNPDYAGKGIFVITGASASAADSATVAQFLNPYGNNATYVTGSTYYFVVDVVGQGAGLYMFKDDSNGDNNIVGDELSPIVLLSGVNAADLSYLNFI